MKLTQEQLKQIIREELQNVLAEENFKSQTRKQPDGAKIILVTGGGLPSMKIPASGGGQTSDLDRSLYQAGYKSVHDLVEKANEGDEDAKQILKNLSEQFPL